jgi:peptidoglycan hydrolase CwlO-like protein
MMKIVKSTKLFSMKTSKIFRVILLVGVLAVSVFPTTTFAKSNAPIVENKEQRIAELQKRLDEIHAMNTKEMTRQQKRVLRTEVKEIKKEMEGISGGVYLSVGAIIIIALLLILLL